MLEAPELGIVIQCDRTCNHFCYNSAFLTHPMHSSNPIPRETDIPFIPLRLPKTGFDLIPGRQYEIDPVARAVIINEYGLQTPQIVECLHRQEDEREIRTLTTNKRTGVVSETLSVAPAREATFRAFFKYKKCAVFTINIEVVENLRQFYVDAPKAPDENDCNIRKHKGESVAGRKKVVMDEALLALLGI